MQRTTSGCSPDLTPSFRARMEESAERNVFIARYPSPALYKKQLIQCHYLHRAQKHQCSFLYSTVAIW